MARSSLEAASAWGRTPGLRSLDVHNGAMIRVRDGALLVSAQVPQWSYALVMSADGGMDAVSIDLEVRAGELGLSVVLDDLVTIVDEVPLSSGSCVTVVQHFPSQVAPAHVLCRSVDPRDRPLCFVVRALEFSRG